MKKKYKSKMCKDCKIKYAQEMGLCRKCQALRINPKSNPYSNAWRAH